MDTPSSPSLPDAAPASSSSLLSRLFNVFATPGDVFDEVKAGKSSTANWLVPVLLSCVVGVVFVCVAFSQPAIQQQMREQQDKQFEKMVEAGKMSSADAERARAGLEAMGMTIIKISGSVGAVLASFAWLFFMALVLWMLGTAPSPATTRTMVCVLSLLGLVLGWSLIKPLDLPWYLRLAFAALIGVVLGLILGLLIQRTKPFHGQIAYRQAVEMTGLATMINVLGGIVGMLLAVVMGSIMATPGPALFIGDFDTTNKTHLLLSSINVMTLWYVGILALALSRLSGVSFAKCALWFYGMWLILRLGIVYAGWAGSGM